MRSIRLVVRPPRQILVLLRGILWVAVSGCLAACAERPATRAPETRPYKSNAATDDVPIYRTVVTAYRPPGHRTMFVIESTDEAASGALGAIERSRGGRWVLRQLDDFEDDQGHLRSADSATIRDLQIANRERPAIPSALADEPRTVLMPERAFRGYSPPGQGDRAGYWREFHHRFPDAVGKFYFSAIGFNPQGTQALVYLLLACESECDGSFLVLLERTTEGWKIVGARRS